MVIWSEFCVESYRDDSHQEGAPVFIIFLDQLVKLVTPPAPLESKTIPSALNGYWITYTEYYTDRYWDQHPSQGFTDDYFHNKTLARSSP